MSNDYILSVLHKSKNMQRDERKIFYKKVSEKMNEEDYIFLIYPSNLLQLFGEDYNKLAIEFLCSVGSPKIDNILFRIFEYFQEDLDLESRTMLYDLFNSVKKPILTEHFNKSLQIAEQENDIVWLSNLKNIVNSGSVKI